MKIKVVLSILIVFMYPISALTFDKQDPHMSEVLGYSDFFWKSTIVELHTSGIASGYIPENYNSPTLILKNGEFNMTGSGIVMRGFGRRNYIVTAAHTVIPSYIQIGNYCSEVAKIDNRVIMIAGAGEVNIIWAHEKMDIAVLRPRENSYLTPSQYKATYTYVSGNSDYTLKIGDALAIIVRTRDKNGKRLDKLEVKRGNVLFTEVLAKDTLPSTFFNKLDIVTDINVLPGDSGSPVFAFRKGMPYLVGIVRAVVRKNDKTLLASYFVRIDPALMYLELDDIIVGDWDRKN